MDKKGVLYFDVTAQPKNEISRDINFGSQDVGTALLELRLVKSGVPMGVSDTAVGIIVLVMSDNTKYTDNVTIIDHRTGVFQYLLSSVQLKHVGIVSGEFFISDGGIRMSAGKFSLTVNQSSSLQDGVIGNGVPDVTFEIDKRGHLIMTHSEDDKLEFKRTKNDTLEVTTWE